MFPEQGKAVFDEFTANGHRMRAWTVIKDRGTVQLTTATVQSVISCSPAV